ncbi:serine O-acetyltransferase [Arsenicicoccus piscis]|uniref:Serine acetyltransferase n=1 Tax=Arsenicicoccus piscis TaxID=673954 RepID=A0ABQ6HP83_9MICO|nr:hypothetical protein [Arsenicicoccus piscis]GMA20275.1 hypothetical protein GCM10025862_22960 [Arsenicicoccus piscis]
MTDVTRTGSVSEALAEARALLRADFPRNPFPIQRVTLTIWRLGQCLNGRPGLAAFAARRVVQVADVIWTRGIIGAELPTQVVAGPGLQLAHGGRGVILHYTTRIGDRASIYHQVTIGVRDDRSAATLGDGVFIGAGAKILGPIHVADGTRVGANAVLTKDTEGHCTYTGVPAVRVGEPRVIEH